MSGHVPDSRLQNYLDGRLEGPERGEVEAHIRACDRCRGELDALRSLLDGIRGLPLEIAPPRDLLGDIHRRTGRTPLGARTLRSVRYPLAAAAALLVVATAAATRVLLERPVPAATPDTGALVEETVPAPMPSARLADEEARYRHAIADMQRTLDRDRGELSPETIDVLERNLRVIDAALAEARAALRRDPQNAVVERMVLSGYRQKLELLRRAAQGGSS